MVPILSEVNAYVNKICLKTRNTHFARWISITFYDNNVSLKLFPHDCFYS